MHYRWYQILQLLFNRKRLTVDSPNASTPPTILDDPLETGPNSRVQTPSIDEGWVDLHTVGPDGEPLVTIKPPEILSSAIPVVSTDDARQSIGKKKRKTKR